MPPPCLSSTTKASSSTSRSGVCPGHRPSSPPFPCPRLTVAPGEPLGRITFELFKDVVPKTAENFRQFCTGQTKDASGRPQGYKNSKFHRIVRPTRPPSLPRPVSLL